MERAVHALRKMFGGRDHCCKEFSLERAEVIVYRKLVWLPWATADRVCCQPCRRPVRLMRPLPRLSGPAEVVSGVTAEVMSVVAEANTYFESDPERYYREIDDALASLVDWRGFATAVMGQYYSRGKSLDPLGRQALKAQRDRFAVVLREGIDSELCQGAIGVWWCANGSDGCRSLAREHSHCVGDASCLRGG